MIACNSEGVQMIINTFPMGMDGIRCAQKKGLLTRNLLMCLINSIA